MTPEQTDAWNCVLMGMGMMPKWWIDKLELFYRMGFKRTDYHDEFFATYDDTRALLQVPNRFRPYVGELPDVGLPKRRTVLGG